MAGCRPDRDYCNKPNDAGAPGRRPEAAGRFSRTPVLRFRSGWVSNPTSLDRAMTRWQDQPAAPH